MLPTKSNHTKDGCVATSSNCVIWQGPDLTCINLCKGDTVSDVVAKLATELCEILDYVNISAYDLSCLDLSVQPTTFDQLIQLIITRLCNAETAIDNIETGGSGGGGGSSSVCPDDCFLQLPPCLYYTDNSTNNLVTTTSLTNFVSKLGSKLCELQNIVGIQNNSIEQIASDLQTLETTVTIIENSIGTLPNVNINCITGTTSTQLNDAVETIAATLCELEATVENLGGNDVTQALLSQCPGLNTSNVLVGSGTMQQIDGWITNPTTVAESLSNLWLTVCDIRTAVGNILTNCCSSVCNGLSIQLEISYNSISNLVSLSFTGNIPSGLSANPLNTVLTISQSGFGGQTLSIPVQNIINSTAYTFTPSPTLNVLSPFSISGTFYAESAEDSCSTAIVSIYTPSADCPVLTLSSDSSTINYSFTSISTITNYQVQLWNSTQTTLISATSYSGSSGPITGTFSLLNSGTTYKVRIGYDLSGGSNYTYCPYSQISTSVLACMPANSATATFNIIFGG
jgi:hypothetical protein